MKYLKLYESFESTSEVLNTINDICLELEDKGFEVNQSKLLESDSLVIITIRKADAYVDSNGVKIGTSFKYDEIEEVVERIKDYIVSLGIERDIRITTEPKITWLSNENDLYRYITLRVYINKIYVTGGNPI